MKLAVGVQGFGEFEGTDGHRQKTDHLRRVIRRHGGHHTIEEAIGVGLRVPEDLSVIGFDDSPIAASAKVPLTTMWQPLSKVGELSAEARNALIQKPKRRPVKSLLR
ncbi:MAG: substrate-binding domain-containing protein, partial [Gemmatimonadetes bacterium]|nr:substrate-binding domain-containing protein [Gemmatimonadota bacterium]